MHARTHKHTHKHTNTHKQTHTQTTTQTHRAQALLYNARDGLLARSIAGGKTRAQVAAIAKQGPPEDTPENRRLGWQRMCLLVLYFSPSGVRRRLGLLPAWQPA